MRFLSRKGIVAFSLTAVAFGFSSQLRLMLLVLNDTNEPQGQSDYFENFHYMSTMEFNYKGFDKNNNGTFVFPTVEERISYYLGSYWSNESITAVGKDFPNRYKCSPSGGDSYKPDTKAVLKMNDIKTSDSKLVREYFEKLNRMFDLVVTNDAHRFALLVQLGDNPPDTKPTLFPVVMKSRYARHITTIGQEPVLLPFNFHRHYGEINTMRSKKNVLMKPWDQKLDKVFWRGATNGPYGCFLFGKSVTGNSCDRLQLVRQYHNITKYHGISVDIGFSDTGKDGSDLSQELANYIRLTYDLKTQLRYKYLISVEGNDVASDLKWKLYSNSVVLMKPPSKVTWAMEDKLVPFYHYIPLKEDFSDLFAKLDWASRHQEECQRIAYQSTKYIESLVASDQAVQDEKLILKSMFHSYQTRFGHYLFESCERRRSEVWDIAFKNASFTFPSVDKRISYYLGSHWTSSASILVKKEEFSPPPILKCSPNLYIPNSQAVLQLEDIHKKRGIVRDYFNKLFPFLTSLQNSTTTSERMAFLVQLGDRPLRMTKTNEFAVFMKSREAHHQYAEPILLPFDFDACYGRILELQDILASDIPPWEDKLDTVVWRGETSGPNGCFMVGHSAFGTCDRLEFVRHFVNFDVHGSITYDIGFSNLVGVSSLVTTEVQRYIKAKRNVKDMIQFKYFVSVEGNDIDPDLTWKLYSNSVVFMKPPTKISWAMENKLVPFYHYVPLAEDFSDLPMKLEWAHRHPEECQQIAAQATQYIESLVLNDQGIQDEQIILTEIFTFYQKRFGHELYDICEEKRKKKETK